MTGFALLAQQQALHVKLTGDATLSALVMGIFDRVPDRTAYPYVTLGEAQAQDWSSATAEGMESEIGLAVYSRDGGRKKTLEILARLYDLLHEGTLTIAGQHLVQMRCERTDVRLLADGQTYRGSLRLRLFTMEAL